MDPIEEQIRGMIADQLQAMKPPCTGLARKVRSGFDQNPRTLATIAIVKTLLLSSAIRPQP